uniref:Uncharacterized protein n=1 Tax=Schizaphis graminum TaxID=13262 RepID=A0A2S2NN17_SCHGA
MLLVKSVLKLKFLFEFLQTKIKYKDLVRTVKLFIVLCVTNVCYLKKNIVILCTINFMTHFCLGFANVLIDLLDGNTGKLFLVSCKELVSTNYESICQFLKLKIFPGMKQIKVLLFKSDLETVKAIKTDIKKYFSKNEFIYMFGACSS